MENSRNSHRISVGKTWRKETFREAEHGRLARWRTWRACDVGKAKEGLQNELWRRWSNRRVGEWAEGKRLQPFRHFTHVTTHSPTLPSLYLRHSRAHSPTCPSLRLRYNSFSNPSVALSTSQLILQHFCCFTYVIAHSPTFFRFSYVTGSYVTWRAKHDKCKYNSIAYLNILLYGICNAWVRSSDMLRKL